jgi:hypothetical protein
VVRYSTARERAVRPQFSALSTVATCVALALMLIGGALRVYRLDVMEFKADEQEALRLAMVLLDDRPWSSDRPFPAHNMPTSNGVPLPPLYTWLIAAAWAAAGDPIGVALIIAMTNTLCLYPLWRWARRRTDEGRALLTLAIAAVSPFAVIFSRKVWNLDLLLPGVVLLLWGVEWFRGGRPWRGITLLVLGALLVQVHLSGPIGMLLLPVAMAAQMLYDRSRGTSFRLGRPSAREAVALTIAVSLTLFFSVPYLNYLAHMPPELIGGRPKLDVVSPTLLVRTEAQIVPVDLLSFFEPHRWEFLRDPIRGGVYYASIALGAPLLAFGVWRWLRSPWSVPVLGIWWWLMIATFAFARIPCHPSYVLMLAPITAVLPAGAFDPPIRRPWIARALTAWRIAYVAVLLVLTVVTGAWLAARGGAQGPYGVAYAIRKAQAESIVSRMRSEPARRVPEAGELGPADTPASVDCGTIPVEVNWLVRWLAPDRPDFPPSLSLCDTWLDRADGLAYRWRLGG